MSKFLLILTFYFDDSDDEGSIEKTFEAEIPRIGESVILGGRKICVTNVYHIPDEGFVEVICDSTMSEAIRVFSEDQIGWEIQLIPNPDYSSERSSELTKNFLSLASRMMDSAMV